jgi:predicted nucleic acid-binding protein
MRLVVADTSPLNYLILIGHAALLHSLFEKIFVPQVVRDELAHMGAPEEVRRWIAAPPAWLEIEPVDLLNNDPDLSRLDDGEHAAILLAEKMHADLQWSMIATVHGLLESAVWRSLEHWAFSISQRVAT